MAKRSYKKRYYRRKGRWSSNIKTITDNSISIPSNSSFFGSQDLCGNPIQSDNTVSQQYTVKNIELTFEIDMKNVSVAASVECLVGYIMFVPQGMTVTETYPNTHPEYIMAYKFIGSPTIDDTINSAPVQNPRLPVRIKTRMARRLQTGDKIILLITGSNLSTTTSVLYVNGLIRWWTKAN